MTAWNKNLKSTIIRYNESVRNCLMASHAEYKMFLDWMNCNKMRF